MGSALSKAARTSAAAAKSTKKPSWSGARIPAYDDKTSPMPRTRQPWASESKDEEIQRDAKDPQLLAKLNRLGPVQVHHHLLPTETQSQVMMELFESRTRAEDEAAAGASMPRNRLHVSSLVALLEERREMMMMAGSGGGAVDDSRQLAEKYGMDVEKVERLVRSVNVPSVREGSAGAGSMRYVRGENGEDISVTEVEWKEPGPPPGRARSAYDA